MDRTNITGNSTAILKLACAIVFCLFTFCYLYFYQVDIMYVEQHLLSGGKTSYNRTIGALLITFILYFLQIGISSLTKLCGRYHSVTYFPSFMVLALITNCVPPTGYGLSFSALTAIALTSGVAYALFVILLRQWQLCERSYSKGLRVYWTNILIMVVMAFMTGLLANNGDNVFHYRMNVEMCLVRGDFKSALKVGYKSADTDSSLTMLRAYALAREEQMGEHLFEYPLVGGSNSLIPDGIKVRSLVYPEKAIRVYARQKGKRDYSLCRSLLDCRLDDFVCLLTKSGADFKSLPKHYREALILYTHVRSNPAVVFHDDVLDADYEDFQHLLKICKENNEGFSRVRDIYGNTYWYYYYQNS